MAGTDGNHRPSELQLEDAVYSTLPHRYLRYEDSDVR
jgi:hypothetical protein